MVYPEEISIRETTYYDSRLTPWGDNNKTTANGVGAEGRRSGTCMASDVAYEKPRETVYFLSKIWPFVELLTVCLLYTSDAADDFAVV